MEDLTVKVDGKEYQVFVEETEDGRILVHCGNDVYEVETKKDAGPSAIERLKNKEKRQCQQGRCSGNNRIKLLNLKSYHEVIKMEKQKLKGMIFAALFAAL